MCKKGVTVMNKTAIATFENIDDIVDLRVEMQIEDWNKTLGKDFSCYSDEFAQITKNHLEDKLNTSIFFAVIYIDDKPVAMAALEELTELPQITVCCDKNGRHCYLVSVYTKPAAVVKVINNRLLNACLSLPNQKALRILHLQLTHLMQFIFIKKLDLGKFQVNIF